MSSPASAQVVLLLSVDWDRADPIKCTHILDSNMCGVFVNILEDDDGAEPDL